MKKYLITAALAVVVSGSFIGCKDEEFNGSRMEQKVEAFEDAFIRAFGQPDPNHTWGFENLGGDELAMTRTENANANEWADPNKAYGGLLVPPPLTDAQIAVVKKYFQTHPNLGYEDPKWSNYFIQQVYKGHTNVPANCATPEAYLAANGSTYIIASDHMDHLIAVDKEKGIYDHINNFNHGDCSTNGTVLDNGGNANDGPFHSDKIMYMMNSTTKSFGYHNSDGSLYHTEYTGLVSYKTIMQAMGAEADCLDDGWNRSFMGFDFEQMVGDDVYSANRQYGNWSAENNWQGELISITYEYYTFEGKQYHYLVADRNKYAADLTEESYKQKNGSNSTIGGVADFNNPPSNDTVRDLLSKGYLPVTGSADKVWVKVGGTADGYFSDWIVTLTEAKTSQTPPPPSDEYTIRVIAEDLTFGKDLNTDFDFNDVVFDVCLKANETKIKLKAAGGTLPLIIGVANPQKDQEYLDYEVHNLWGEAVNVMINTHAEKKGLPNASKPDYILTLNTTYTNARDIPVYVKKSGTWVELKAIQGEPASKIGVDTTFQWVDERTSLKGSYTRFADWVQGKLGKEVKWW